MKIFDLRSSLALVLVGVALGFDLRKDIYVTSNHSGSFLFNTQATSDLK